LAEANEWKENGEAVVDKSTFETDREYTVWEILKGNLKVWWLMLVGALAGAMLLGGYKYYSNRSYISEKNYEDDYRVMASLFVEEYSTESAAERVGTVITVAGSRSTYEKMKQLSGYDMEYLAYQDMFDLEQNTSSAVITVHVKYPRTYGTFSLENESDALEFAGYLLEAIEDTVQESIGKNGVHVLDAPYVADVQQRYLAYAPTIQEFKQEIAKAAVAGTFFGILIEVAIYAGICVSDKKRGI
jgi:hypothetical protein